MSNKSGHSAFVPRWLVRGIMSQVFRSTAVVVLVALFTFYPWSASSPVSYDSSDPRLVYVSQSIGGGAIFDNPSKQVRIIANSTGGPRLDFVSSDNSFAFASDIEIVQQALNPIVNSSGGQSNPHSPLVLKLWHPVSPVEARLVYRLVDSRTGWIYFQVFSGQVTTLNRTIVPYVVGERFHFETVWNRNSLSAFSLSNSNGPILSWTSTKNVTTADTADYLDRAWTLGISAFPEGAGFTSVALLSNPVYTFPGNGRFASFVADRTPLLVMGLIICAILLLLLPEEKKWLSRISAWWRVYSRWSIRAVANHWAAFVVLTLSALVYAFFAFNFGGHQFDNTIFKTWSYSAQIGGLQGIYGRAASVGDAFFRGDHQPWGSMSFAYLPLAAYLMYGMSFLIPPLSQFPTQLSLFQSAVLEGEIKFYLSLFTLAAGGFLYAVVLRTTGHRGRALIAMSVFLLNPAIIFDSAVWGETDSVLYLALAIFAWLAAKRPGLALAIFPLVLAFKQTATPLVFPAVLIASLPLWKIGGWMMNWARGSALLILGMVPLLLGGVLPSALFYPIINVHDKVGYPVSSDTYTIWTAFTGLFGVSGFDRLQLNAKTNVVAGVSFFYLGYICLFCAVGLVLFGARLRSHVFPVSFWYATMGFVPVAVATLVTGTASRYYTLAIPGLVGATVLSWQTLSRKMKALALSITVLASFIAFWTMAGLLGWITIYVFPDTRGLNASTNIVIGFIERYYLNDVIITLGSVGAMILVMFSAWFVIERASSSARVEELVYSRAEAERVDSDKLDTTGQLAPNLVDTSLFTVFVQRCEQEKLGLLSCRRW